MGVIKCDNLGIGNVFDYSTSFCNHLHDAATELSMRCWQSTLSNKNKYTHSILKGWCEYIRCWI